MPKTQKQTILCSEVEKTNSQVLQVVFKWKFNFELLFSFLLLEFLCRFLFNVESIAIKSIGDRRIITIKVNEHTHVRNQSKVV